MENHAEAPQVELTPELVLTALKGLFSALEDAFETDEYSGTVQAYETITNLRDMVQESPDMIKFLFTGENLIRFQALAEKKKQTGEVAISDILAAFPEILQALNPANMFSGMFGK